MLLGHLRVMDMNLSIKALIDSSFFCLVSNRVVTVIKKSRQKEAFMKLLTEPGRSSIN